ncbi:MLP-like protein 423 isoform X1 [Actinidia eriantha]|uniref:MLP-like protein 423 isoform X1 n=1 Tax=Actinidia eriantha TaxID=165200 RepID=UPI0025907F4C|nr:MLP-like protein 423 isoform X1 [Actinidia eriantha]
MAQLYRLEHQIEIKSSPDRFFDIYKNKTYLMPKISPDNIQSIQVLEGDGRSVGSVRMWTYILDFLFYSWHRKNYKGKGKQKGSPVIAKDKIDAVDEENKSITFDLIGGEVTNYYKSFKATLQATSKDGTNLAKWTLEYEKANENVPTPHSHIDFLATLGREIDSYLLKA